MKGFRPISSIVKPGLPLSDDPPAEEALQTELIDFWKNHIGIAAPHTHPLLFRSGRMVVFCDSSVWATQIRHQIPSLKLQLKHHLNAESFEISDIKIRIIPIGSVKPVSSVQNKVANPISQSNANAIKNTAQGIRNENLKESLFRLSRNSQKTRNKPGSS